MRDVCWTSTSGQQNVHVSRYLQHPMTILKRCALAKHAVQALAGRGGGGRVGPKEIVISELGASALNCMTVARATF